MKLRHPLNVVGDFYVEDGCCTACMLPHYEAPGFLADPGETSDGHCFVVRQPQTPEELDRAIHAMCVAELLCIRYGGGDPQVRARILELGQQNRFPDILTECCDEPPGADELPGVRE